MPAPVITVEQMRHWEQASWDAGRSQSEVIGNASRAVARLALELTRSGDSILIIAGKGHNGDDARGATPYLDNRQVRVIDAREPRQARDELRSTPAAALLIDGLFGIGLSRPLDPDWAELIDAMNDHGCAILAVDVPSGLNADTGEPQQTSVRARTTLTLGAPKRGLLAPGAHRFVGRLELASHIGLVPCPFTAELQWTEQGDFAGFPPAREVESHKGTYGHVVICAGSLGYHGAAVMAARGALRARPGLVSVFCDPAVYSPVASQLQAAMVHPFEEGLKIPATTSALVIGCGLAARNLDPRWRQFVLEQWRSSPQPVILDASALEWIKTGPTPQSACRVITPHPGEAGRLLGVKADVVQGNRMGAVRELSRRYGDCWVILKGHHTLVGRSSGEIFVNPSGNPYLAQGGAGDVLAGFIGGLFAQQALRSRPLDTLRYAVWCHGATADALNHLHPAWTVEELLQQLGNCAP